MFGAAATPRYQLVGAGGPLASLPQSDFSRDAVRSQPARAGEGELQMQLVHAPHQCKIGGRHRTRLVVKTATTDVQHGRLPRQWEIMNAVNHRLALSNPALSSALSKKSFSSVSSPIFACSALMSTSGVDGLAPELVANTEVAPSRS